MGPPGLLCSQPYLDHCSPATCVLRWPLLGGALPGSDALNSCLGADERIHNCLDWRLMMKSTFLCAVVVIGIVAGLAGCSSNTGNGGMGNNATSKSGTDNGGAGYSGTASSDKPVPSQWKSENFDVSAMLPAGWRTASYINTPGDTYDRPDRVLVAFMNKSGPYSYIIRMENDVPLDVLATEDWIEAVRHQHEEHPGCELIDEADIDFHSCRFHRFRYRFLGGKGPSAMCIHLHRNGTRSVSIQMTFPLAADGSLDLPTPLVDFDRGVKIDLAGSQTPGATE